MSFRYPSSSSAWTEEMTMVMVIVVMVTVVMVIVVMVIVVMVIVVMVTVVMVIVVMVIVVSDSSDDGDGEQCNFANDKHSCTILI